MEFRTLGASGLRASLVGLGCNNFGGRIPESDAREVVSAALDAGINFFDTADNYGNRGGSERFLGEVLGARRNDIILASKFGMQMDDTGKLQGASRQYVMSAVEASLTRLRTDRIDLYQLHKPDPTVPIDETLRALEDLVRQGKVRAIGCSNFSGAQLTEAASAARAAGTGAFVTCQNEYSLLVRDIEGDLVPAMQREGVVMLPFYPLGAGMLTGKYRRDQALPDGTRIQRLKMFSDRFLNDRNWSMVTALQDFCDRRGHPLLELAFSWLAAQPCIGSIIAGASTAAQLRANVAAVNWKLSADDLREIDSLTT